MPDPRETVLSMTKAFVIEALDIARVHLDWTQTHLDEGRDARAVASFESFLTASREAATEMKAVRASVDGDPIAKAAVVEFRAERERRPRSAPRVR